ncbi:MAG TPA: hypothetical protein VJ302_27830 [Blastocatellia bacterium]|nr:hypothetical protein [Blastocatellia bacterium]
MTEREAFVKRERWLEERYFRQLEETLITRLRQRRELREITGITDEQVLDDLQELGYTGETVESLPYLVPLLQVAWSEGFVTARERRRILELARREGLGEGTPGYRRLCGWLDQRPSDKLFRRTLQIIRYLFGMLPPGERERRRHDLMNRCLAVASASGSVLEYWVPISATEWKTLQRIAVELEGPPGNAH